MDSEADPESHFRMDHISNNDFFFDNCETDNFNDFVHNTSDSNDAEGVAHLLGANTHAGNMNMNLNGVNGINGVNHMNLGLNMDMDMDMNLTGMNTINMPQLGHVSHPQHKDNTGNTDSLAKGNSGNNNKVDSTSRPTSEGSGVGGGATIITPSIENINENESTNTTSPLEKTTTATSVSSMKQKSSPKRVLDKRRGSMSTDDTGNQQKRTRASGEILEYLMNEFAKNSNPTTAMRKEISNKTGMPERSVRIWFQNRRAKARKMEKLNQKDSNPSSAGGGEGDSQNTENTGFLNEQNPSQSQPLSEPLNRAHSQSPNTAQRDMKGALSQMNTLPIEINGKYYVIECKSLSVGNWQRIRSGYVKEESLKTLTNLSPRLLSEIMATTDLLVILSKKDKELNYFFSGVFQNEKVLFRIFYPLVNILKCSLLNQTQQMNNNENYNPEYNETLLQIELGATPQFAVHFLRDPATGKENANQWSICEDFSEGQQVATAYIGEGGTGLPHILSDDLNRLKYFNTLISSINKLSIPKTTTTKISTFPGPGPESQIINPSQFSPLNHPSTNNSTPSSINMMPNYPGFPQNSYNVGLNDDGEILGSDLIYSLGNGSNLSAGSVHHHNQQQQQQQYQPQSQMQMQQMQRQFQQHVQQQQQQQQQQQHVQQQQQQQQPQHQHQNQQQQHQHQQHPHPHQHQQYVQQQQHQNMQQQQPGQTGQIQQHTINQSSPHDLGNQRSMYVSQMQQKKLSQQGGRHAYNSSNSMISSNIGLEGMFNSTGVDSDPGEGKVESSDLDIFRQDHIHNGEDAIIKANDDNLASSDPILLAAGGREGLLDAAGVDNEFIKQESDNFFLDDGINGLGF